MMAGKVEENNVFGYYASAGLNELKGASPDFIGSKTYLATSERKQDLLDLWDTEVDHTLSEDQLREISTQEEYEKMLQELEHARWLSTKDQYQEV